MDKAMSPQKQKAPIEWGELRRRLQASQALLEPERLLTVEEKKRILRARARALARPPEKRAAGEERFEVLEFLLAYERYGVESSCIQEVVPLRELTLIPGTPPFVLGVINLRGQILSVIDLKKFFDLPEKGLTDLNKVIVVRSEDMVIGILADAILGLRSVSVREAQLSLPTLTGIRSEYLKGVTPEPMAVLDVKRLLSDRNLVVHQQVDA